MPRKKLDHEFPDRVVLKVDDHDGEDNTPLFGIYGSRTEAVTRTPDLVATYRLVRVERLKIKEVIVKV